MKPSENQARKADDPDVYLDPFVWQEFTCRTDAMIVVNLVMMSKGRRSAIASRSVIPLL